MTDQDDFVTNAVRLRMQGQELDCTHCQHFLTLSKIRWCTKYRDSPPARGSSNKYMCNDFHLGKPND